MVVAGVLLLLILMMKVINHWHNQEGILEVSSLVHGISFMRVRTHLAYHVA